MFYTNLVCAPFVFLFKYISHPEVKIHVYLLLFFKCYNVLHTLTIIQLLQFTKKILH